MDPKDKLNTVGKYSKKWIIEQRNGLKWENTIRKGSKKRKR